MSGAFGNNEGAVRDSKARSRKTIPTGRRTEEELKKKVSRLGELNALLDMDKKDSPLLDEEPDESVEEKEKNN